MTNKFQKILYKGGQLASVGLETGKTEVWGKWPFLEACSKYCTSFSHSKLAENHRQYQLRRWWWNLIASFFHFIIPQQYTLNDLNNEIQYKGCRKLIDSENPLFISFLSYKEMGEKMKKNLCTEKKILRLTIIASVLVENMIFSIFLFLFSSPLHSKAPSYKDDTRAGSDHLDCLVHGKICKLTNWSQKANRKASKTSL